MKKKHITTKAALAAKLDVSRPTLDKFLAQPGAPKREPDGWNLEAVLAHVAESAAHDSTAAKASPKLRNLRCREIALRCERLAFRIAVEKREYVLRSDACAAISRIGAEMRQLLRLQLEQIYPTTVAGLDPVQVRIYGKKLVDSILEKMQTLGVHLENL